MVLPGGKVEYEGKSLAPDIRIQTKWWNAEKHGPLPPFPVRGGSTSSSMPASSHAICLASDTGLP